MILTGTTMIIGILLYSLFAPLPGGGEDAKVLESHARFFGMGITVGLMFITGGVIEITIAFLRSLF